MAAPGDNQVDKQPRPGNSGVAPAQLKAIVERIEQLADEKQALADDMKDIFAEAKFNGFDTKTIRTVLKMRKQDRADREEQEALVAIYLSALGMI